MHIWTFQKPKNEFYIGFGTGIDQTNGLNNFSGNVFITEKKNIIPLKNSSSEVMKYIVSGGISGAIKA